MIRQTSIHAYNAIKENGMLSRRRWQVYDSLFRHGPLTGSELMLKIRNDHNVPIATNTNVTTRLGELRSMGVVYEIRERDCSITGQKVIEWDVTDRLPAKLEKPKRIKCAHCNGRGYHQSQQTRLL